VIVIVSSNYYENYISSPKTLAVENTFLDLFFDCRPI